MADSNNVEGPDGFNTDPRWQVIADETLRRPPVPLGVPGRVAHLVFMTAGDVADAQRAHIRTLIEEQGATIDLDRFDQILAATDELTIKWERHTEFCSLTFFETRGEMESAPWPPVSPQWAAACPGDLVVALKIALGAPDAARPLRDGAEARLTPAWALSSVNGGGAEIEAHYRPGADKYLHLWVRTGETLADRTGRLVQRLIEIETYRQLALYAWPDVQALGPRLNAVDAGLARLTEQLGSVSRQDEDADRRLLASLTDLARDLEKITAQTHFRLNAALAYAELVDRRLEDLREERVEGAQRLSSLINRRLKPAVRTCRAILVRQREMSGRMARSSDLLRSRIDVELAQQNQQLLKSMDRRADQQLRLQQTVEGLSVVAISYYALGILGYLLTLAAHYWAGLNVKLATGICAPFMVILVYLAVRRIRRHVVKPRE